MRHYEINTILEKVSFIGERLTNLHRPDWQYYITEEKEIFHFRKKHIVYIKETLLKLDE